MQPSQHVFRVAIGLASLTIASCGSSDSTGLNSGGPGQGASGGEAGSAGTGGSEGGASGSSGSSGAGGTAEPECERMLAKLPEFPFELSTMAHPGREYLNQLATDYVCGLAEGEEIDNSYFFYGYAPVTAFNQIIAGERNRLGEMRWVFHVSGYFGGLWLHGALNPTQQSGDPPSGWSAINAVNLAKEATDAVQGSDDKLFEYNKSSLQGFIFPSLKIASDFGYNKGYLLEIYESPPAGLSKPPDYVACGQLLWCDYADKRVPSLSTVKYVSKKLSESGGRWEDLRDGILPAGVESAQGTGDTMGRAVWGTFMQKDGLNQENYIQLLDVSASFLEVVQAAGLFSAKGYAEQDAEAGRTGALIQSGMAFWLASYMAAFPLGQGAEPDLPIIVPAP